MLSLVDHTRLLRLVTLLILCVMLIALSEFVLDRVSAQGSQAIAVAADPVIAAAGDIACDPADPDFTSGAGTATRCRQKDTSDLLVGAGLAAVLPLGDNQNQCGSLTSFRQVYSQTWGRVLGISHPVPGNREYQTTTVSFGTDCTPANINASGYFSYFGSLAGDPVKGYYSYDVGSWHLIALNSNCANVGGCSAAQPQGVWLQSDLDAHPNQCTLAYWHQPLFSSGGRSSAMFKPFWNTLYAHKVDVVLNAEDQIYERFAPQTPDGVADPNGIREFIAGMGGVGHTTISTTIAANSEVRNAGTFGVLKLTLRAKTYDWQFVPIAGQSFTDSGTSFCHQTTIQRLLLPVIMR